MQRQNRTVFNWKQTEDEDDRSRLTRLQQTKSVSAALTENRSKERYNSCWSTQFAPPCK